MRSWVVLIILTLVVEPVFSAATTAAAPLTSLEVEGATHLLLNISTEQIKEKLKGAFLGDGGFCDQDRAATGVSSENLTLLSKLCQRLRAYDRASAGLQSCGQKEGSREKEISEEILCLMSQTGPNKVPCQNLNQTLTKDVENLHNQTQEIADSLAYDEIVKLSIQNAAEVYWAIQKKFEPIYGAKTPKQMADDVCHNCEAAGKEIVVQRLNELSKLPTLTPSFQTRQEVLENLKQAMGQVNVAANEVVANVDSGIFHTKPKFDSAQETKYQNYVSEYRNALNSPAGVLLVTDSFKKKIGGLLSEDDKNNFDPERQDDKQNGKITQFRLKGHSVKALDSENDLNKAVAELNDTLKSEMTALTFFSGGKRSYLSNGSKGGAIRATVVPADKIENFIFTSPIPVAQYLLAHPEAASRFCELIKKGVKSEQFTKGTTRALLTGSVVVTGLGIVSFGGGFVLGAGMAGTAAALATVTSVAGATAMATGLAATSLHLYDSLNQYDLAKQGRLSFIAGNAGEGHAVEIDQAYRELQSAELQFVVDGVIAPLAGFALGKAMTTELAQKKGAQLLADLKEFKETLRIAKNAGKAPLAELVSRGEAAGMSTDKFLLRMTHESSETQSKVYDLLKDESPDGIKKFFKRLLAECKK